MRAQATVVVDEPIGIVSRNIFGQFIEHLGRCVDEGLWVGEDSPIPNVRGIRSDVVAALRRIGPGVIRWPGGCFADDYHWRDGIGPRADRPRRHNIHWGNAIEANAFGTHEFIDLCRQVGAEPYISLNLGSGTLEEARGWVEYCNGTGSSSLTEERRRNGSPEPFNVRYWGIGNELWGCGGQLQPAAYAAEAKRYLNFLGYGDVFAIACGPSGNSLPEVRRDWSVEFFREYAKVQHPSQRNIDGYALHYYTRSAEFGGGLTFGGDAYYRSLEGAAHMRALVDHTRAAMDAWDPDRSITLVVDEWGTWHPEARDNAGLEQANTMRDALVAALHLDIFVNRADVVGMANIAQAANVLQAMVLTDGDRMVLTPSYHVFDLYRQHHEGRALRLLVDAPTVTVPGTSGAPVVAGSASASEGRLTVTLTNAHLDSPVEVDLALIGRDRPSVRSARGRQLAGADARAHNTHEDPDAVSPVAVPVSWSGGDRTTLTLPPHSVSALELELA